MDEVHISAFPDHLISHEDMPGQHTKRGGPQDLKYNTQLFMYFIGVNVKVTVSKGNSSEGYRGQEEFPGSKGTTVYSYQPLQLYCETYEADGASIPQLSPSLDTLSPSLDTLSRSSAWKRTSASPHLPQEERGLCLHHQDAPISWHLSKPAA